MAPWSSEDFFKFSDSIFFILLIYFVSATLIARVDYLHEGLFKMKLYFFLLAEGSLPLQYDSHVRPCRYHLKILTSLLKTPHWGGGGVCSREPWGGLLAVAFNVLHIKSIRRPSILFVHICCVASLC